MIRSENIHNADAFRIGKQIAFSAPILKGAAASERGQGWTSVSTEPADVIDVNGNGQADYTSVRGDSTAVTLTEPALYFPTMKQIEQAAADNNGAQIVTQDALPEVYVSFPTVNGGELGKEDVQSHTNVMPLRVFLGRTLDNASPNLKYAFDVKNGALLAWDEPEFQGGACSRLS